MKLVYQHMVIFVYFSLSSSTTSRELHSNSRLVVDEDDNGKFRLERVKALNYLYTNLGEQSVFSNLKSSYMS